MNMNRIDLAKFGFARSSREDFSDDGTRFVCYRVGNVRVSKAVWKDQVFLDGRYEADGPQLEFEEYSKLPHYKSLAKLNGVSKESLTDADLRDLYEACAAYGKEYEEALSKVSYPTVEEIAAVRKKIREAREAEASEILRLAASDVDKLLSSKLSAMSGLMNLYAQLKSDANPADSDESYAKNLFKTSLSRTIVSPGYVERETSESWKSRKCKEILKEAGVA